MISGLVAAMLAAQLVRLAQDPVPSQPSGSASSGKAVTIDGHVSLSGDVLPNMDAAELRPQLMLDARGGWAREKVRYRVQAIFEALVADRDTRVTDALAAIRDAWIETSGSRTEVRVGYGRLVWGRLEEAVSALFTARSRRAGCTMWLHRFAALEAQLAPVST